MGSVATGTDTRAALAAIVGESEVIDHGPSVPGATPRRPWLTVRPADTDQVQRIVRLANDTLTPLVPVSSAAPHRRGGSAPSVDGVVEVDLRRMNRIPRLDRRNRIALIEPGVTYEQLVPALAAQGMRIAMPLVPKPGKSVIASLLEREPLVAPRFAWSAMEPLRTLEVIWGNGEKLYTGNGHLRGEKDADWEAGLVPLVAGGPGQLDFFRLIAGAQGAMGIATWASVKCEPISDASSLLLISADALEDLIACTYELVRIRFGDELFVMNADAMALLVEAQPTARAELAAAMPAWMLVVGIGGGSIAGTLKLAGREADVREIAARHGLPVHDQLPGIAGRELLARLQAPSPAPYWRDRPETGSEEVFFLTTLDRAPEFVATVASLAAALPDPVAGVGVYLQPIHQGAGLHCELILPFDKRRSGAKAAARDLKRSASRAVFERGAYFSRPYGEWAAMAFGADPATAALTRTVKGVFDPRNVMNPGTLCFPTTVGGSYDACP
jgi:FAD/FMN-containing dehydrogenase